MAIHCKHCGKYFRWTRSRCPYCRHSNSCSPRALAVILLTSVITITAIWFIVKAVMERNDVAAGVVQPAPEEESVLKRIFRTPEPAKTDDVRFNR